MSSYSGRIAPSPRIPARVGHDRAAPAVSLIKEDCVCPTSDILHQFLRDVTIAAMTLQLQEQETLRTQITEVGVQHAALASALEQKREENHALQQQLQQVKDDIRARAGIIATKERLVQQQEDQLCAAREKLEQRQAASKKEQVLFEAEQSRREAALREREDACDERERIVSTREELQSRIREEGALELESSGPAKAPAVYNQTKPTSQRAQRRHEVNAINSTRKAIHVPAIRRTATTQNESHTASRSNGVKGMTPMSPSSNAALICAQRLLAPSSEANSVAPVVKSVRLASASDKARSVPGPSKVSATWPAHRKIMPTVKSDSGASMRLRCGQPPQLSAQETDVKNAVVSKSSAVKSSSSCASNPPLQRSIRSAGDIQKTRTAGSKQVPVECAQKRTFGQLRKPAAQANTKSKTPSNDGATVAGQVTQAPTASVMTSTPSSIPLPSWARGIRRRARIPLAALA